jgi:hypothetical protein
MIKFTDPPSFILTTLGISSWLLAPAGELLGYLSNGGSVIHCPKLTVALAKGPSIAIAEDAVRPIPQKVITPIIDSIECFICFSS